METIHLHSYKKLEESVCAQAAALAARFGACTVLVEGLERATNVKKSLARAGVGLGVGVETPSSWVRDLWETYGDGRALVDALDRALMMRAAAYDLLEQGRLPMLRPTAGVVELLGKLVKLAAPQVRAHVSRERLSAAETESLLVA